MAHNTGTMCSGLLNISWQVDWMTVIATCRWIGWQWLQLADGFYDSDSNWLVDWVVVIPTGWWIGWQWFQLAGGLNDCDSNWQMDWMPVILTGRWILCQWFQLAGGLDDSDSNWQVDWMSVFPTGRWIGCQWFQPAGYETFEQKYVKYISSYRQRCMTSLIWNQGPAMPFEYYLRRFCSKHSCNWSFCQMCYAQKRLSVLWFLWLR